MAQAFSKNTSDKEEKQINWMKNRRWRTMIKRTMKRRLLLRRRDLSRGATAENQDLDIEDIRAPMRYLQIKLGESGITRDGKEKI